MTFVLSTSRLNNTIANLQFRINYLSFEHQDWIDKYKKMIKILEESSRVSKPK